MKWIERISAWLHRLPDMTFRRRLAVAFAAGLLMALAMPPLGLFPVLYVSLPLLFFLLSAETNPWRGGVTGFVFAFAFFLLGLYWVPFSMLTDVARYWWFIPIAAAALPAMLSSVHGVAGWVFVRATQWARARGTPFSTLAAICLFVLLYFAAEYARGHLFTGFPWHLPAYAWSGNLALMQHLAYIGAYASSLLTLCLAMAPVPLFMAPSSRRRLLVCMAVMILLPALLWGGGMLRLAAHPVQWDESVKLRIVQPNIEQVLKWQPGMMDRHFATLVDMSIAGLEDAGITHVIWPETATAAGLIRDADVRRHLLDLAEQQGLEMPSLPDRLDALRLAVPQGGMLITGMPYSVLGENGDLLYYNAMLAFDADGVMRGQYLKHHLVPFGEYTPLRGVPGVAQLAASDGDFSEGPDRILFDLPGLPNFSPLICYEIIFPGRVMDRQREAEWILNITNDAWFGESAGPHQHLAIARFRAIEERRPVIRVANTGISAVIGPMGQIAASGNLGEHIVIDSYLPKPLPAGIWPVHQRNDYILCLCVASLLLLLLKETKKRRSSHKKT